MHVFIDELNYREQAKEQIDTEIEWKYIIT